MKNSALKSTGFSRKTSFLLIAILFSLTLLLHSFIVHASSDEKLDGPTSFQLEIYEDDWDSGFKLVWNSNYDDYKVEIEKSAGSKKNFSVISSEWYESGEQNYIDTDIVKGVPYYYRLRIVAFRATEEVHDEWDYTYTDTVTHEGASPYATTDKCIFSLAKPEILGIKAGDNKSVTLYWGEVPDADGYRIYRRKGKKGDYQLVKTLTTKAKKVTDYSSKYYGNYKYTQKKLILGATYYYKVCAYSLLGNKKYTNEPSKAKKVRTTINKTKIVNGVSAKPFTNTIKWKTVWKADGYIVYCSKKQDSGYKKIKTLKGKFKTRFTHKKLVNGKCYYYKVVAYKKIKGGKLYSKSEAFAKISNYYGYYTESYYEKCQRIFGKNEYINYTSAAEADSHMTTININVWDINSSGGKYTRTFTLTVHENIAPTVRQMFQEIYESKERFPIHSIGGYGFRDGSRSEHKEGLAIDINPVENYMIDNGTILAGSFWDPASSPYSIPLKCDLVKIMNKYGFYRGFWRNGTRRDYMHFSYFGG